MDQSFINAARELIGADYVLTRVSEMGPYLEEWRGAFSGRAGAVLRPKDAGQTADIVRLCARRRVGIVPQSGNTGLSGGAVAGSSEHEVIVSLERLNRIRALDPADFTLTAESGCILQQVQEAARAADRLFPLDLAARGSCRVGGLVATNAGGTNVLRYGTARDLTLGLEVVLADGRVWDGLSRLRKDNTGYDLKNLFVGSEGTLGIITAATFRLFALPRHAETAWVALDHLDDALRVFNALSESCDAWLTGCELISGTALGFVLEHIDGARSPVEAGAPWHVLIELTGNQQTPMREMLEQTLARLLDDDTVRDVVLADSLAQRASLWQVRDQISEAQRREGASIKHDLSVPLSSIPAFVDTTSRLLERRFPGIRPCVFGHLGDGNLHYNLSQPVASRPADFLARRVEINELVHDNLARYEGSFSAEHGVGLLKRDAMARYKGPTALGLMRAIKQTLDPTDIMNPGKVLPDDTRPE